MEPLKSFRYYFSNVAKFMELTIDLSYFIALICLSSSFSGIAFDIEKLSGHLMSNLPLFFYELITLLLTFAAVGFILPFLTLLLLEGFSVLRLGIVYKARFRKSRTNNSFDDFFHKEIPQRMAESVAEVYIELNDRHFNIAVNSLKKAKGSRISMRLTVILAIYLYIRVTVSQSPLNFIDFIIYAFLILFIISYSLNSKMEEGFTSLRLVTLKEDRIILKLRQQLKGHPFIHQHKTSRNRINLNVFEIKRAPKGKIDSYIVIIDKALARQFTRRYDLWTKLGADQFKFILLDPFDYLPTLEKKNLRTIVPDDSFNLERYVNQILLPDSLSESK